MAISYHLLLLSIVLIGAVPRSDNFIAPFLRVWMICLVLHLYPYAQGVPSDR